MANVCDYTLMLATKFKKSPWFQLSRHLNTCSSLSTAETAHCPLGKWLRNIMEGNAANVGRAVVKFPVFGKFAGPYCSLQTMCKQENNHPAKDAKSTQTQAQTTIFGGMVV